MIEPALCRNCGRPLLHSDALSGRCPLCLLQQGFESGVGSGEDFESANGPPDPSEIGRYRILRRIGEGGMGVVYEAEQDHPRRTVALKIIKPGMASPELLRRFEQESQALGRLQHPGIAQIYEAGTVDTGFGPQPYFAMELIRGSSPRDYAEAHHLGTRERLEIMAKICDAVHHAHQRGLIHRDLKPGNILIDESGQPKILDFGVARVTDSDARATLQTDVGQLIGTLAYMSPEQVLADPMDIDTRSDVYSLGVILYEFLSGRLPYPISKKIHETIQSIREEDPARLSGVNRAFRGDIETIVARALEKDRSRRYGSAAEMAADIQRYLKDEPIVARPPSTTYQLRKFARRNRALVAGIAAVFVVLVAGVGAFAWQAAQATQERDRAVQAKREADIERDRANVSERNATIQSERAAVSEQKAVSERSNALMEKDRADSEAVIAKAVQNFLGNDLLRLANPAQQDRSSQTNPNITVKELLDRAAQRIGNQFDNQPLVEATIREVIGETYHGMGDDLKAREQLERAIELRRREQGDGHLETLNAKVRLVAILAKLRSFPAAETLVRQVIQDGRRDAGGDNPATRSAITWFASIQTNPFNLNRGRRLPEDETFLMDLIADLRLQLGDDNRTTRSAISDLVSFHIAQPSPRYEKAEIFLKNLFESERRKFGDDHPATLDTLNEIFRLYMSQRSEPHYAQAEAFLKPVVEDQRRKHGYANRAVQNSMEMLIHVYLDQPQPKLAEATTLMEEALDTSRRKYGDADRIVRSFSYRLATLYFKQNRYADAEGLLVPLVNDSAVNRILKGGQAATDEGMGMLDSMDLLSQVYAKLGKTHQADELAKAVGSVFEVLGDAEPGSGAVVPYANEGLLTMGMFGLRYLSEGRTKEGNSLIKKTLDRYQSIARIDPNAAGIGNFLVSFAAVTLKDAEAEGFIKQMLDIQRSERGDYDNSVISTMRVLADLYWEHDRYPEAEEVRLSITEAEREVLGPTHAGTLFTMTGTATLYASDYSFSRLHGRPEQAKHAAENGAKFYAQLVEEDRKASGRLTTGLPIIGLASVNAILGKYAEAEIIYTEILAAQRAANSAGVVRVSSIAAIGWLQFRQKKYIEAEKNLMDAWDGFKRAPSNTADAWQRFNIESMLGSTLAAQGKFSEAEEYLVEGYEQMLQRKPNQVGNFFQPVMFMAESEPGDRILKFYQDWGKPDKVEEWRRKVQGAPNFSMIAPSKPLRPQMLPRY